MQLVRMVLAFLFSMSLTLATGLGLVRAAGGQPGSPAAGQAAAPENQSDLDIGGGSMTHPLSRPHGR